jgi:hypothetical protein
MSTLRIKEELEKAYDLTSLIAIKKISSRMVRACACSN